MYVLLVFSKNGQIRLNLSNFKWGVRTIFFCILKRLRHVVIDERAGTSNLTETRPSKCHFFVKKIARAYIGVVIQRRHDYVVSGAQLTARDGVGDVESEGRHVATKCDLHCMCACVAPVERLQFEWKPLRQTAFPSQIW